MKQLLVSINIVTFNGERYIKKTLESVANQSYKNIEVNILDNNSQDGTVQLVKKLRKNLELHATCYKSRRFSRDPDPQTSGLQANMGFAKGHNILIDKSRGEYIIMLNQDAFLDKDFVKRGVEIFAKNATIGAVQSKMYRYNVEKEAAVKKDGKPVIDATGLVMLKNRRVIARGQGQEDRGQFEKEEEVFGADGAAPMFRRKALENIKIPQASSLKPHASWEYFDEDFFMYKEDVDLSWRMRLYGWKIVYSPTLVAYHERGSGDSAAENYIHILRERKHISQLAKSLSWRNQRLMQVKNELPSLYARNFPRIFLKEILSFLYILLFERYAIGSVKDFFSLLPRTLKKRSFIMAHKKVSAHTMLPWFQ